MKLCPSELRLLTFNATHVIGHRQVRIQFKDVPSGSFLFDDRTLPRNELVMKLKPAEQIYFKTNVKAPGLENKPIQSELDLTYGERYPSLYK